MHVINWLFSYFESIPPTTFQNSSISILPYSGTTLSIFYFLYSSTFSAVYFPVSNPIISFSSFYSPVMSSSPIINLPFSNSVEISPGDDIQTVYPSLSENVY